MAYSLALTAEAENAPPAISHADPKTHTPLLRVKERGQRFYSPGRGRWVNRDPIGEYGGANLYIFVANRSLDGFDVLGMLWNQPVRDPSRSRAPVSRNMATPNATVAELASIVRLDASQAFGPNGWLRTLSGNEVPDDEAMQDACWFSVPNEAHITWGTSWGQYSWLRARADRIINEWYNTKNYKIVDWDPRTRPVNSGQTKTQVHSLLENRPDMYVWSHYGHGLQGPGFYGKLEFEEPPDYTHLAPSEVQPLFRLAEVVLYSCAAGDMAAEWKAQTVAPGGSLWSTPNLIFPAFGNVIPLPGTVPTWYDWYKPLTEQQ